MSEIKCRRQRLTTLRFERLPLAHLFEDDSETALCGYPKKNKRATRVWDEVPDPQPGDVCWQ